MRIGRPIQTAKPASRGPQEETENLEAIDEASGALGGARAPGMEGLNGAGETDGIDQIGQAKGADPRGLNEDPFKKIDAAHAAAAGDMERGISAQGRAGAVGADQAANLAGANDPVDAPNLAKGLENPSAPKGADRPEDNNQSEFVLHTPLPDQHADTVFSDNFVDEALGVVSAAERQIAAEARASQKVGGAKSGSGGGGAGSGGGGGR